jgi:uncharacterized Zn-binding protein involved in type VI secretion
MPYTIEGKHVIVLGDTTTHGGKVITGSENHTYMGIPVARVGDMVECPKCDGTFPIVDGAPRAFDHGRPIALHGDKVACGATLISREVDPTAQGSLDSILLADSGTIVSDAGGVMPANRHLSPEQQAAITTSAQDWVNSKVPYLYGGSNKQGADCSGSISAIYKQSGIDIKRLTSNQFTQPPFYPVPHGSPLEVGDVGVYPGHVVLYGGDTGPGNDIWSAFHTGGPVFGTANSNSTFRARGVPTWYRYGGNNY